MKFNKQILNVYIACFLFFMKVAYSLRIKHQQENSDHIVLKLSPNYMEQFDDEKLNNFKNIIFRELDQSIGDNKFVKNRKQPDYFSNNIVGEYYSTKRELKFYISHDQLCSVFVNDTVHYTTINSVNFIEHMILHNNAESIEPKGVYSEDININFFAFNRKLNIFSVYFDQKKNSEKSTRKISEIHSSAADSNASGGSNNILIEFNYNAMNLIKTIISEHKNENSTLIDASADAGVDSFKNYNSFIWKILNQNFIKHKETVSIDLFFDLGRNFVNEDVEFSLNFTKSIIEENKKQIVKFHWEGEIEPQDVIILQAKFPLYFNSCGNISINLVMIFIGSIFIIFLIGMLYIILSTVFSGES